MRNLLCFQAGIPVKIRWGLGFSFCSRRVESRFSSYPTWYLVHRRRNFIWYLQYGPTFRIYHAHNFYLFTTKVQNARYFVFLLHPCDDLLKPKGRKRPSRTVTGTKSVTRKRGEKTTSLRRSLIFHNYNLSSAFLQPLTVRVQSLYCYFRKATLPIPMSKPNC